MPNPTDISDLYVRLIAESIGGSNDDPVSAWDNSVGAYLNFVQADGGKQPIYRENVYDGKPGVRFSKASDAWLGTSDNADLSGQPYTVIVAFKRSGDGRQNLLRAGDPTTSQPDLDFYFDVLDRETRPVVVHNSPDSRSFAFSEKHFVTFEDELHVWGYTVPSEVESETTGFFDGQEIAMKAGLERNDMLMNANIPLTLGMDFGAAGGLDADVVEVLIYRRDLTPTEHEKIWMYFRAKYNLAPSLPRRVSNLFEWFETEDLALADLDPVTVWNGRMSNFDLQQSTSSEQPSFSASNSSIQFSRGTSLETLSDVDLDNEAFSTFLLYRPLDFERNDLFEVGSNALKFSRAPSRALEQVEVTGKSGALRVVSSPVPVVTEAFRTLGVSIRDIREAATSFYVEGRDAAIEEATSTDDTLLESNGVVKIGGDFAGEILSMIMVKGRIDPEDRAYIETYWQDKYLNKKSGAAFLSGSANLKDFGGSADISMSAAGTLTAIVATEIAATASLSSSASLTTALGDVEKGGTLSATATATLAADSSTVVVFFLVSGSLLADSVTEFGGATDLTGTATVTADPTIVAGQQAVLNGSATFTPNLGQNISGQAALTSSATITALGGETEPGTASLSASGTQTSVAESERADSAALITASTLTAVGSKGTEAQASLTVTSTATFTSVLKAGGVSLRAGGATLTADPVLDATGATSLTATGTVSPTAGGNFEADATSLDSTGAITVLGTRPVWGASALAASGSLTADALSGGLGSASLSATGSISPTGNGEFVGLSALAGAGSVTALPEA